MGEQGSTLAVISLFLALVVGMVSLSLTAISELRREQFDNELETRAAKDANANAIELVNSLINSRAIEGHLAAPNFTAAFFQSDLVFGNGVRFTSGFAKDAGRAPVASLLVSACNPRTLSQTQLRQIYSPTPALPTMCQKIYTRAIFGSVKNGTTKGDSYIQLETSSTTSEQI